MITGKFPGLRLRRNRKNDWSRRLVQENNLTTNDFILPIFLIEGKNIKQPIKSMPGVYRYTIDKLSPVVENAIKIGIPMIALFPYTPNKNKDKLGSEALNENNLVCKALRLIKKKFSLTYYLDVGDQNCKEPGILKFQNPENEILPTNGMVMIFPSDRKHSATYDGEKDRIMIGVNFYSLI